MAVKCRHEGTMSSESCLVVMFSGKDLVLFSPFVCLITSCTWGKLFNDMITWPETKSSFSVFRHSSMIEFFLTLYTVF